MKMVKSLILGSAAGLVAMSGAQAADLPVKAKAVEYVKICSLYGAGFWYIPGTDTCIKLGGYLRAEVGLNTNSIFNGQYSGISGAHNRLSNYDTWRSREDLTLDTRTATEYGVVRTFFDVTFSWTTGGFPANGTTPNGTTYDANNPAGTGSGQIAGGAVGVYHAFIQFAGFTMGRTISAFDTPWVNYPANNFDGLVGGGGTVTGVNQFTYTWQFGNGISGILSAQDPVGYGQAGLLNLTGATAAGMLGGANGLNNIAGTRAPDLIAVLKADQAWGGWQASFVAHNNTPGFYGASEFTGSPGTNWGWAAQLALNFKADWIAPGDTLNLQGVYTDGATRYNLQSLAAVNYSMFSGTSAFPNAYQSVGFANAPDAVYTGTSLLNGSNLENVKTWGFRGGYNHNWNPYWVTGIYGAYASIQYGGLGKTAICANATALLGLVGTCNPDFNIAQAGIITRWTPVKNLTFSGDFTWTRIDQKYSGTVVSPLLAAVAKPAALYELRDQDSYNFLLRAQRNF
jgi:porin-like protein